MIINKANFTCITQTELKHTDLYTVFITVDCMLKNLTVGILKTCTRLCLIEQSRRKLQQMIKDTLKRMVTNWCCHLVALVVNTQNTSIITMT